MTVKGKYLALNWCSYSGTILEFTGKSDGRWIEYIHFDGYTTFMMTGYFKMHVENGNLIKLETPLHYVLLGVAE